MTWALYFDMYIMYMISGISLIACTLSILPYFLMAMDLMKHVLMLCVLILERAIFCVNKNITCFYR